MVAHGATKAELIEAQQVFEIGFERELVEVHSHNAHVETRELPTKATRFAEAQMKVLKSLEGCLAEIDSQLQHAGNRAPEMALAVANNVLQSSELLQERTQHFASLAMEQAHAEHLDIHVHPSCIEYLEAMAESATGQVRLLPAPELKPGDCRVSYDGLGVEAKLDNFLIAAAIQLKKQEAAS